LGFKAQDAGSLYQILVEVFGDRRIFLVDEVQNVTGWEHFVRLMGLGLKFYIIGSNASLADCALCGEKTLNHQDTSDTKEGMGLGSSSAAIRSAFTVESVS
jgi:hypothetical protein